MADVQAMRRRVDRAHLRPRSAAARSSSARVGCATSSSRCSCCSWCTVAATSRCAVAATLPALAALRDGGYVGRDDAVSLADAYRFLRAAEHRLQLRRLRRTHLVPEEPGDLRLAGPRDGLPPRRARRRRRVFDAEWALHAREVRRLHEKLFYRPLLEAVARVPSEGLRLTPTRPAGGWPRSASPTRRRRCGTSRR